MNNKDKVLVQYMGYTAKPLVREYRFNVRRAEGEMLEFTVTILNEAFSSQRARFQDAPDICSHRLQRELAAPPSDHATKNHYRISDADLEEYRVTHSPKPRSLFRKPVPVDY